MNKVQNLLTFDLEFWYDSEFIKNREKLAKENDFVLEGTEKILKILDAYNTKATFFVTGKILEQYPEIIKKLYKKGHEIASHSYEHTMLNKLGREKFEEGLKLSKELIKKITGKDPLGFRAPSWSISKNEFWAYDVLHKLRFKYSSSLFPMNMGLYGNYGFPTYKFNPLPNSELVEIPIVPFKKIKLMVPFSGGVYFRLFPKNLINFFIKEMNEKNQEIIVYLHPWEFCPKLPRVKTSAIGNIITYYGLKNNAEKFKSILSDFMFCPIRDFINKKYN